MLECLFSEGVTEKVTSCILELVLNLLKLDELKEEEGEEHDFAGEEMECCSDGRMAAAAVGCSGVNLVLPLVPRLLEYLRTVIRGSGVCSGGRQSRDSLQLEFLVLSRLD